MLGSHAEKKQRRRYGRRFNRALGATESIQGGALNQQEALQRLATQQQLGGYDTARKEASRLGRGAKRNALDREQQVGAQISQNLQNRGLSSTTAGGNLSRGLSADTSRTMAGVDEGLAGLYGDLAIGRGGVEAGGSLALGQIAGERGDLMSSLAQMRHMRDLYGSTPWGGGAALPQREAGFGQNLLGGIQTGLGTYMGMGGGGGMGGMNPQMLQWLFSQGQGFGGHSLGSMGMGGSGGISGVGSR